MTDPTPLPEGVQLRLDRALTLTQQQLRAAASLCSQNSMPLTADNVIGVAKVLASNYLAEVTCG